MTLKRPGEDHTLMTVHEVSQLMRVSPITVRRMVQRGELTGFQIGKVFRVHRESVERVVHPELTDAR